MKILRLGLVLAGVALLAYGIFYVRYPVRSLASGEAVATSGLAFTEAATFDGVLRQPADDQLYDALSLTPVAAQEKDCKT